MLQVVHNVSGITEIFEKLRLRVVEVFTSSLQHNTILFPDQLYLDTMQYTSFFHVSRCATEPSLMERLVKSGRDAEKQAFQIEISVVRLTFSTIC